MRTFLFSVTAISVALFPSYSFAAQNIEIAPTAILSQSEVSQKAEDSVSGVVYETDAEGQFVRLRATGEAELEFGDAKDIRKATQMATMRAKANIAKFFSERVTSEEVMESLEKSKTKTNGEDKTAIRDTVEKYAETIKVNAEYLMKGIIVTKTDINKESKVVSVEVGLSPRTLSVADEVNKKMNSDNAREDVNNNDERSVKKIKNYDSF